MANPNSQAELGYGSHLEFEMTPNVYQEVEECGDMPDFGDQVEEIEVTNQQSPGRRKEFKGGLAEGQEFSVPCNYFKGTVQEAVRRAAGSVRNFRAVYSTTPETVFQFPALIKSAPISGPVKAMKQMTINLRVTGDVEEL